MGLFYAKIQITYMYIKHSSKEEHSFSPYLCADGDRNRVKNREKLVEMFWDIERDPHFKFYSSIKFHSSIYDVLINKSFIIPPNYFMDNIPYESSFIPTFNSKKWNQNFGCPIFSNLEYL